MQLHTKKFIIQYRPLMLKINKELCNALLTKNQRPASGSILINVIIVESHICRAKHIEVQQISVGSIW